MIADRDILITGGAGFIGSNAVEMLIERNRICVFDNLTATDSRYLKKYEGDKNFKFQKIDIKNISDADPGNFDFVLHLAANSDVMRGSLNPLVDLKENVEGTVSLLEYMRKNDCGEIAFSSSSTVFGEAAVMPTPEDYGPCLPISSYGASKLACEGFITAYAHYYGIRATIFRFANIVGKNSTHGVIHDFIVKLKKDGTRLEVLGDGSQKKSYMHVSDCIGAMQFLLEKRKSAVEIYNLGNREATSVKRIAELIIKAMGLDHVHLDFKGGVDGRGWKGDVKYVQLDITRMERAGWKNRYSSDEAVERAIAETLRQM